MKKHPEHWTEKQRRFYEIMQDAEDGDRIRVCDDYSGRGMYGKTCPAVVAPSQREVFAILADEWEGDRGDIIRACSVDSMGLGVVVYLR